MLGERTAYISKLRTSLEVVSLNYSHFSAKIELFQEEHDQLHHSLYPNIKAS